MNDDWRVHARVADDDTARELTRRLEAFEAAHELGEQFGDRVAVSRDGADVFIYAGSPEQAKAAERAVRQLGAEHDWPVISELRRWHPVAEEWEDPENPLPSDEREREEERAELMREEREESRTQGYPSFEVKVTCPTQEDARRFAEQLRGEGVPTAQRWRYVVLGAEDEDSAAALAERVRREAPPASTVVAEGSVRKVAEEAPFATPFSPFSVFGGLGG